MTEMDFDGERVVIAGHVRCNLHRLIKKKEIRENRESSCRMIRSHTGINPATLSAMANNKVIRYS